MVASVAAPNPWVWRAALAVVLACALWFALQDPANVIAPLLLMAATGLLFLWRERARAGGAAPLTIGVVFAGVVTVYGTYPLLIYLLLDGSYTPLNDSRLFTGQPLAEEITHIAWYYALYLGSFVVGYLLVNRERGSRCAAALQDHDLATTWAVIVAFVVLRLSTLVAEALFAAPAQDYVETYLKYRHLPLLAQQLLGHAEGIAAVLAIAVVVLACRDWRRFRWLVFAWFGFETASLLVGLGSRTQLALLILAALVSYHHLHRPLSTSRIFGAAGLMLVGFLAIGAARAMQISGLTGVGADVLTGASEFETLFANAYDIDRMLATGELSRGTLFVSVYFGDLIALVPQQLVPFEKLNLSQWYVETFHPAYAEAGGGLVFGAISESLLGLGAFDIVWRAGLLGAVFAWFDQRVQRRAQSFWSFVVYAWLAVFCYQAFRVSTFTLFAHVLYRLLPAILLVVVLALLLRSAALRPELADDARISPLPR